MRLWESAPSAHLTVYVPPFCDSRHIGRAPLSGRVALLKVAFTRPSVPPFLLPRPRGGAFSWRRPSLPFVLSLVRSPGAATVISHSLAPRAANAHAQAFLPLAGYLTAGGMGRRSMRAAPRQKPTSRRRLFAPSSLGAGSVLDEGGNVGPREKDNEGEEDHVPNQVADPHLNRRVLSRKKLSKSSMAMRPLA